MKRKDSRIDLTDEDDDVPTSRKRFKVTKIRHVDRDEELENEELEKEEQGSNRSSSLIVKLPLPGGAKQGIPVNNGAGADTVNNFGDAAATADENEQEGDSIAVVPRKNLKQTVTIDEHDGGERNGSTEIDDQNKTGESTSEPASASGEAITAPVETAATPGAIISTTTNSSQTEDVPTTAQESAEAIQQSSSVVSVQPPSKSAQEEVVDLREVTPVQGATISAARTEAPSAPANGDSIDLREVTPVQDTIASTVQTPAAPAPERNQQAAIASAATSSINNERPPPTQGNGPTQAAQNDTRPLTSRSLYDIPEIAPELVPQYSTAEGITYRDPNKFNLKRTFWERWTPVDYVNLSEHLRMQFDPVPFSIATGKPVEEVNLIVSRLVANPLYEGAEAVKRGEEGFTQLRELFKKHGTPSRVWCDGKIRGTLQSIAAGSVRIILDDAKTAREIPAKELGRADMKYLLDNSVDKDFEELFGMSKKGYLEYLEKMKKTKAKAASFTQEESNAS